ncbi:MAG TPA: hypothetical protein DEQ40_00375 [Oxalobacteraceae bacterium]|jgi:hypothetical protein|nr:hypothetical protein [Oxalobacteraceae bacterium]
MLKWLANIYHALLSPTAGEYLTKLKANAEAGYSAELAKVEKVYAADLAVVEAVGHKELNALEHTIAHAQERVKALLASEVDLGERNVDAAMLHLNLTKAVAAK